MSIDLVTPHSSPGRTEFSHAKETLYKKKSIVKKVAYIFKKFISTLILFSRTLCSFTAKWIRRVSKACKVFIQSLFFKKEFQSKANLSWDSLPFSEKRGYILPKCANRPTISKIVRFGMRDRTVSTVVDKLGGEVKEPLSKDFAELSTACQKTEFSPEVTALLNNTRLYIDSSSLNTCSGTQMLGRFDVLEAECNMNCDEMWSPEGVKGNSTFLVHTAAFLCIGEWWNSEDFPEYSHNFKEIRSTKKPKLRYSGTLNIKKFLHDTGKIIGNLLLAQKKSGIEEAIWLPGGMGAFMRNLWKCDSSFKSKDGDWGDPKKMWKLKKQVAQVFVNEMMKVSGFNIHLSLYKDDNPQKKEEYQSRRALSANQTYNAFIHAIENTPGASKKITVHSNSCAVSLSQKFADQGKLVSMINAGNRNMFGNLWLTIWALNAIDENLARRSWQLALVFSLLNGGSKRQMRGPNYLTNRVRALSGQVLDI